MQLGRVMVQGSGGERRLYPFFPQISRSHPSREVGFASASMRQTGGGDGWDPGETDEMGRYLTVISTLSSARIKAA